MKIKLYNGQDIVIISNGMIKYSVPSMRYNMIYCKGMFQTMLRYAKTHYELWYRMRRTIFFSCKVIESLIRYYHYDMKPKPRGPRYFNYSPIQQLQQCFKYTAFFILFRLPINNNNRQHDFGAKICKYESCFEHTQHEAPAFAI